MKKVILLILILVPNFAVAFPEILLDVWHLSSEIDYQHEVIEGRDDLKSKLTLCYTERYYGEGIKMVLELSSYNFEHVIMTMSDLGHGNLDSVRGCSIGNINRNVDGVHYSKSATEIDNDGFEYLSKWKGPNENDYSFKEESFTISLVNECIIEVNHKFHIRSDHPGLKGNAFETKTSAKFQMRRKYRCNESL